MDAHGAEDINPEKQPGVWFVLTQIDWSEKWLLGLMLFHLLCAAITVATRKMMTVHALHFVGLLTMVYFAETINEWAARNWRLFARQQYFDSSGMFISTLFSTPILLNCVVIVILWMTNASSMLVNVKTTKLRKQQHAQKIAMESKHRDRKKE